MVANKGPFNGLKPYSHTPFLPTSFIVHEEDGVDVPLLEQIQQPHLSNIHVPQLIAAQAAVTPDAVAVATSRQQISYRELNQKADRLAHYLQQLGIQRNMLVGLCVERSPDMIVGLLGILKAGGAYVPLDPAYPSERLTFMLDDAGVSVLVTQQHLLSRLSASLITTVCLDSDSMFTVQPDESITFPQVTLADADLAYMIYTSGSTGQPKGVPITHGSLMNLIYWHQHAFAVSSSDRATQLTSPAFDATGWELWPYLTIGASVYLPDEETRIAPTLLRDWLLNYKITLTFLPTPLAENIMALEWPAVASLRILLTGADTLHRYPSSALPFVVVNNYGPTEATVVATSGVVPPTPDAPDTPALPSIGKPIDNTQIYILDEQLRPVTGREPGEIYIGGAGLATGYHNRPELTAERFIRHPFSDDPSARLYRTGDRAHWLPDGQISFLGRNDYQIKIRGYRIEPGEIAIALNRHPAIQASVIVTKQDMPGDEHLVAYVVLVPTMQVTASSLRDALMSSLPSYMIPAIFVQLQTLPLMLNGKVDRAALPAPDMTNTIRDSSSLAPTTPLEEWLADIIASLLKLKQMGMDENFFMLGGHSLLGAQVIMRISAELGVDLSLRTLFSAPTVRLLATEVEQRLQAQLDTMSYDEVQQLLQ